MVGIVRAKIDVTADCGHKFPVSLDGLGPHTDLICPTCGAIDHLSAEQVADLEAKLARGIAQLITKGVGELVNQGLAQPLKDRVGFIYRPK
jgi:hypothetical protein